jgi:hypothetical protein
VQASRRPKSHTSRCRWRWSCWAWLIREEGEELVLEDGPADAAAVLVEPLGVANGLACTDAVDKDAALVGVQAGTVQREEGAAVELVGAALGGDERLRAAEAAILCVVVVGDDADVVNGIFGGRDD